MKILLTGATGFIGHHLAKRFSQSHEVAALIRRDSLLKRGKQKNVRYLMYTTFSDLDSIFKDNAFDVVIHLATIYAKEDRSIDTLREMNTTNIILPLELTLLAIKYQVKAFLNTGTCFEYQRQRVPVTEETKQDPLNYYSVTKISFENELSYLARKNQIRALTLKLFFVYGEGDNDKLIPLIIKSILNQKPVTLSKGEQKLNFTYVADVVSAFEKALAFVMSKNYDHYENINIGATTAYSIRDIVTYLGEVAKKPVPVTFSAPYQENEIMYMNCQISKATSLLGWKPTSTITSGLRNTYEYYQKEGNKT